jgi:hypothetical protein
MRGHAFQYSRLVHAALANEASDNDFGQQRPNQKEPQTGKKSHKSECGHNMGVVISAHFRTFSCHFVVTSYQTGIRKSE